MEGGWNVALDSSVEEDLGSSYCFPGSRTFDFEVGGGRGGGREGRHGRDRSRRTSELPRRLTLTPSESPRAFGSCCSWNLIPNASSRGLRRLSGSSRVVEEGMDGRDRCG